METNNINNTKREFVMTVLNLKQTSIQHPAIDLQIHTTTGIIKYSSVTNCYLLNDTFWIPAVSEVCNIVEQMGCQKTNESIYNYGVLVKQLLDGTNR